MIQLSSARLQTVNEWSQTADGSSPPEGSRSRFVHRSAVCQSASELPHIHHRIPNSSLEPLHSKEILHQPFPQSSNTVHLLKLFLNTIQRFVPSASLRRSPFGILIMASLMGTVKSVLSGDTIVLANPKGAERTLSLAYISAPRLKREGDEVSPTLQAIQTQLTLISPSLSSHASSFVDSS